MSDRRRSAGLPSLPFLLPGQSAHELDRNRPPDDHHAVVVTDDEIARLDPQPTADDRAAERPIMVAARLPPGHS